MKKIISVMFIFVLFTMLMLTSVVYGVTCTFDQTATTVGTSSTYITGVSQNLSVTLSAWAASDDNLTTATISISSGTITGDLTYNSSTETNVSYMNTTVNTMALADETAYTFTMTVRNFTDQNVVGTCTRVYYTDNGVPVMSGTTPTTDTTQSVNKEQVFTASCENSSTNTLWLDGVSYTMSESSDTCTYTKDYLSRGGHSWYVVGSDGLNSTTSSTLTLSIRDAGGLVPGQTSTTTTSTTGGNNPVALIIVAIVGYMLFFNNKKGVTKRRKKR